jgi:hypothetical protein
MPVPDLKFSQPARRNLLAPVLLAFLILGIVMALFLRFTPHRTADITVLHTTTYHAHTVFQSDSILVNHGQAQDDLYVLTTLRIEDNLRLPLFLKDFTATLTTAEGEQLTTSAIEKDDLPTLFTAFPALVPLASEPLLRETMINPGGVVEGMILLRFPVTEDVWLHRRNAVLNIDLYHQGMQTVLIGRGSEATPKPAPNKSSQAQ